jgi:hypothetical protein
MAKTAAAQSKLASLSDMQVQRLSAMTAQNQTELQQKYSTKTPDNLGDIYAAIKKASHNFTDLHAEPNIAEAERLLVEKLEAKGFFNKLEAPTTRKPAPATLTRLQVCNAYLKALETL